MIKQYTRLAYAITTLILLQFAQDAKAQAPIKHKHIDWFTGIGVGLDYGGVGLKLEYLPAPWLGISLGGGYNLAGIGLNGAISYKIIPKQEVTPVVTAMYGYNAVIIDKYKRSGNQIVVKTIYYGPSIGGGVDCAVGRLKQNKITMLVLIPFRTKEFHEDAEGNKQVIPISFSLGFNWGY